MTAQPNPRSRGGRPADRDRLLSEVLRTGASRKETVAVFGITGAALDSMVRRGCPRLPGGKFDLPAVAAWRQEHAVEVASARDVPGDSEAALCAWRTARAARETLALQRDRREVVAVAEVAARDVRQVHTVKMRLNDLARKVPLKLWPPDSREAVDLELVLQQEIDSICNDFSNGTATTTAAPAANGDPAP